MRLALAVVLASCAWAHATQYELKHRILDPELSKDEQQPFVTRAVIDVDLDLNSTAVRAVDPLVLPEHYDLHDKLYHIRLAQSGVDLFELVHDSCCLFRRKSKPFKETLKLEHSRTGELVGWVYDTADSRYACDRTLDIDSFLEPASSSSSSLSDTDTLTIQLERDPWPSSLLKDAPALVEWDEREGTPRKPAPEKSFVAKYWMYLIPFVLVLLLPAPEEQPAKK